MQQNLPEPLVSLSWRQQPDANQQEIQIAHMLLTSKTICSNPNVIVYSGLSGRRISTILETFVANWQKLLVSRPT